MAPRRDPAVVRLIGAFKLLKGLLLAALGVGVLRLLHGDVGEAIAAWIATLHVDPENRYVTALLEKISGADERTLRKLSAGTFVYAALLLTEGIGLLRLRRWAEYLTVIATGLLVPLEIYELVRKFTIVRVTVLVVNVAIVVYLIWRLRERD